MVGLVRDHLQDKVSQRRSHVCNVSWGSPKIAHRFCCNPDTNFRSLLKTNLVLQMISNKANLLDSFVVLYATLVGSLHRIIGLEFGELLSSLVGAEEGSLKSLWYRVTEMWTKWAPEGGSAAVGHSQLLSNEANLYETPDAGKEALNLLTLIAELYNAGVIGSGLIYDLIRVPREIHSRTYIEEA
jgi:hypothetical protein